jgi:holliday junction DNA helicase RuvA
LKDIDYFRTMIAYLNGTIEKKLPKSVILNTGNIGYLVHVPTPLWEKIEEKTDLELFVHTKVSEDDIRLFGFETMGELDFFKTLINVNGIGPKLGIEILSQDPSKVKAAIIGSDIGELSKIPGIGKKTAERIVVELKNKIDIADIDLARTHKSLDGDKHDEAIEALLGLGYQRFEILKILKRLPENLKQTEEIITYFLRNV